MWNLYQLHFLPSIFRHAALLFCSHWQDQFRHLRNLWLYAGAGIQSGLEFFAIYEKPKDIRTFGGAYVGHWGTGTALRLGYLIPTSIMARIGNLAVKDNEKSFGGAVGFGVVPFGFNIPLEKGFMMSFNFCAEFDFKGWGLRLDLPLKKYTSTYKSYTGDIPSVKTN